MGNNKMKIQLEVVKEQKRYVDYVIWIHNMLSMLELSVWVNHCISNIIFTFINIYVEL